MTVAELSLHDLSDRDLLTLVERAAGDERQTTARLIAALMELDARKLYAQQGCSSLFTYCTQVLHFSEHAAYLRIEAARSARKFPIVLERLAEGALHLTAIGLLAPHLTPAKSRRGARCRSPQEPTRGRRAGGTSAAEAGCAGSCSQAARTETSR